MSDRLRQKVESHPRQRLCQNSEMKERSSTDYADYADFFLKRQTKPNHSKVNLRNRRNLRMAFLVLTQSQQWVTDLGIESGDSIRTNHFVLATLSLSSANLVLSLLQKLRTWVWPRQTKFSSSSVPKRGICACLHSNKGARAQGTSVPSFHVPTCKHGGLPCPINGLSADDLFQYSLPGSSVTYPLQLNGFRRHRHDRSGRLVGIREDR